MLKSGEMPKLIDILEMMVDKQLLSSFEQLFWLKFCARTAWTSSGVRCGKVFGVELV